MEFAYAGGGLGKGGAVSLYVDGQKVGEGSVDATAALIFSGDDGCDVGEDSGGAVSPDYGPVGNAFTGRVKGVQLAIADTADNSSHIVSPEDGWRLAMARQWSRRAPRERPGDPPGSARRSAGLRRQSVFLFSPGDDLQRAIVQRPLKRGGFFPRCGKPNVYFLWTAQDHRHRFRMDQFHLGVQWAR